MPFWVDATREELEKVGFEVIEEREIKINQREEREIKNEKRI